MKHLHTQHGFQNRRRRGIFLTDALVGLSILALLLTIAAVTLGHERRVSRAAAEHRALTTAAEEALLVIAHGETPGDPPEGAMLTVQPLPDGEAPDGLVWAEVAVTRDGQSVQLIGLVPTGLIDDAEGRAP